MAAPNEARLLGRNLCKLLARSNNKFYLNMIHCRQMGFMDKLKFLQKRKEAKAEQGEDVVTMESKDRLPEKQTRQFQKRQGIEEHKPYRPPAKVVQVIETITQEIYGPSENWLQIKLTNRIHKFNLLTRVMEELNKDIGNFDLHNLNTVEDVVKYFGTAVKDTSVLEDLTKLDLPKNLHMNLEYIRFHPETDKIFDGVTAFPGRATKVTSIKYRRKYKGYDGGDPVNYPEQIIGRS